jgi:hypothetical protein
MSYMSSMIRNGMTNLMRDMWIRMVSDNTQEVISLCIH